jgi:nicotinamidase-related amidase
VGHTALIVVDMLNPYGHEDADLLTVSVAEAIGPMRELIDRARESDVPVIYVNDNHGDWTSSSEKIVECALKGARPDLVEPIVPPEGATFVIKARHTTFYQTPFEYLLRQRDISRLVMTGQVTEQCVLYSALDAYVRHFQVAVPSDAVAHIHSNLAEAALEMMARNMKAEVALASELDLQGERTSVRA